MVQSDNEWRKFLIDTGGYRDIDILPYSNPNLNSTSMICNGDKFTKNFQVPGINSKNEKWKVWQRVINRVGY